MKRRLVLTAGALVAALSFSSCSTVDHNDVAATVNGHELTRDQLDKLVEQELADLAVTRASNDLIEAPTATSEIDIYRNAITGWARLVLVEGESYSTMPTSANEINLRVSAALPLMERTDADGAAFYESGPSAVGLACLSAISTADKAKAEEALAAIEDGMAFADAAVEFNDDASLQQSRGVVLGPDGSDCIGTDQFAPALIDIIDSLVVGEPSDVVPLNETWVIVVARPWDQVLPASQAAITNAAPPSQVREGDVSVASRFGTWNAESLSVVAPTAG